MRVAATGQTVAQSPEYSHTPEMCAHCISGWATFALAAAMSDQRTGSFKPPTRSEAGWNNRAHNSNPSGTTARVIGRIADRRNGPVRRRRSVLQLKTANTHGHQANATRADHTYYRHLRAQRQPGHAAQRRDADRVRANDI